MAGKAEGAPEPTGLWIIAMSRAKRRAKRPVEKVTNRTGKAQPSTTRRAILILSLSVKEEDNNGNGSAYRLNLRQDLEVERRKKMVESKAQRKSTLLGTKTPPMMKRVRLKTIQL